MSIFREHKTIADRSASDRSRHKKKIEKAIKEGIHSIVSDESIISHDGKKRINIPVRGIKEYRFIYGDNKDNSQVGSAPGKELQRGQKVGDAQKQKDQQGNKGGKDKGEEYYEVEITLEELAEYLFADLELPDLAKKTIKNITGEKWKRHGYRNDGIRPRLDKKQTAINRIKRIKATERLRAMAFKADAGSDVLNPDAEEKRFPYHENDLRYRHIKKDVKESSNAVIFFMMDVSGSMSQEKKFLARSFYFLLYHFINSRYKKCDVVFIAHDTEAHEVDEERFFKRGNGGGTVVSSGLQLVKDIIDKRYHPSSWNIYCFQCSDGDNWSDDNQRAITMAAQIKDVAQLFGYCQIEPRAERAAWDKDSKLLSTYMPLVDSNFKMVEIAEKSDIWPAFKKLLGKRVQVSG
jgi:sporulation protein YhbH